MRISTWKAKSWKRDYLGTSDNFSVDYSSETEKARASFRRIKKLLCSRDLSMDLRTRMLKCPVLLYGVEPWTLNVYWKLSRYGQTVGC